MKTDCPSNPNLNSNGTRKKVHNFQVRNIEEIRFILCDYCDASMGTPITTNFMSHVSEDSLTRVTTALIEKTSWSKAEETLIEHLKKEVF